MTNGGLAAMDSIDFFNLFTLALLERLYGEFPTPVEIETKVLGTGLLPEDIDQDAGFKLLGSTDDAMTFLAEEGFITHQGSYLEGGTFLQVRLTAKGLAVLGSTPGSLENREPLVARIRKALAGGAKEAGSETVKQLVQQAFAAAVAAAPAIVAQITRDG